MNFFQKIFKSKQKPKNNSLFVAPFSMFSAWSGDAWENDIYRAGVDAISRNVSKLKANHVIHDGDKRNPGNDAKLNRLLQTQPNPYMSAADMLYKLCAHYYLYNNSFAYVQRNMRGQTMGVFPFDVSNVQFYSDAAGSIFCRFYFQNGAEALLPYSDIIHLRRHFNGNELLGDANTALSPAVALAHAQNAGLESSIKTSSNISGILHYTQILAPDKLKEEKERFMADYLTISNSGGIVATDSKTEYTPITHNVNGINSEQMEAVKTKIYDYLGITQKIVNSSYSEDEFSAFYESVIEPFALQMSLEFTRKLFTDREREFGNSIVFESGRLVFSSNNTKIKLISGLVPYGLLTVNQALEILNLPTVEDGDKRLQTLNVVDAAKANQYQLDVGQLTTEQINREENIK